MEKFITSTFKNNDCIFLLKDLTNEIKEVSIDEKEKLIASGINYSEMISKEYPVSKEINEIFKTTLEKDVEKLAYLTGAIAEEIYNRGKENAA